MKTNTELALQQEATRIITTIFDRAESANKTPREILEADPFLLGQATMLGNILSYCDYAANIDIPQNTIDLFM